MASLKDFDSFLCTSVSKFIEIHVDCRFLTVC